MDNTITLFTTRKFTSAKFIINSLVITVLQRYLQCFLQNVEINFELILFLKFACTTAHRP